MVTHGFSGKRLWKLSVKVLNRGEKTALADCNRDIQTIFLFTVGEKGHHVSAVSDMYVWYDDGNVKQIAST